MCVRLGRPRAEARQRGVRACHSGRSSPSGPVLEDVQKLIPGRDGVLNQVPRPRARVRPTQSQNRSDVAVAVHAGTVLSMRVPAGLRQGGHQECLQVPAKPKAGYSRESKSPWCSCAALSTVFRRPGQQLAAVRGCVLTFGSRSGTPKHVVRIQESPGTGTLVGGDIDLPIAKWLPAVWGMLGRLLRVRPELSTRVTSCGVLVRHRWRPPPDKLVQQPVAVHIFTLGGLPVTSATCSSFAISREWQSPHPSLLFVVPSITLTALDHSALPTRCYRVRSH
jgi:hypothetical protein